MNTTPARDYGSAREEIRTLVMYGPEGPGELAAALDRHAAEVRAAALTEAAEAVAKHTGNPIDANAQMLRRMAAAARHETEAHPAEHTWAAELYAPLADEWAPGTRYTDRDRAVKHLEHANTIGPAWKDGTPVKRRLVRSTTTHTVEQAAARPDDTTGA